MATLKVFRTPIGFHDAYVAAPSQKAALKAWGADADLFARGQAERVEDPALTAAPLARPGEVVKVVRGSAAEHLDALPPDPKPRRRAKAAPTADAKPAKAPPRTTAKRPSRAKVEAANAALETLERDHRAALAAIRREEAAIAQRRRAAERDHVAARARLAKRRDAAERAWRGAMDAWRAAQD